MQQNEEFLIIAEMAAILCKMTTIWYYIVYNYEVWWLKSKCSDEAFLDLHRHTVLTRWKMWIECKNNKWWCHKSSDKNIAGVWQNRVEAICFLPWVKIHLYSTWLPEMKRPSNDVRHLYFLDLTNKIICPTEGPWRQVEQGLEGTCSKG